MSDPFQSFSGPSPLMVPNRGTRLTEAAPEPPIMSKEDLFGPPAMSKEELFGQPKMYVGSKPPIEYFNQGFTSQFRPDEPFGIKPLTQAEKDRGAFDIPKFLYDQGILKKADDQSRTILNEFNELLIMGVPAAVDFTFRGVMGTVYGLSEVMRAGGVPKDLTPAAYLEAFPLARATPGFPTRPTLPRGPSIVDLDHAEQLGLTGKKPAETAREAFAPENAGERIGEAPRNTTFDNRLGFAEPVRRESTPPDMDTVARSLNPSVFTRYDDLMAQRRAHEEFIAEQLQPDVIRVGGREVPSDTPLSEVRGFNFEETPITRGISPETGQLIEQSRTTLRDIDRQLLGLSEEMREAYAEAARLTPEERRTPREDETHARARAPEAFDKLYELEDRRDARAAELADLEQVDPFTIKEGGEAAQARRLELHKEIADIDAELREVRPAIDEARRAEARSEDPTASETQRAINLLDAEGTITPERLVEALGLTEENATKLSRQVLNLSQQRRSIARDTETRLINAGRPADEARLAGQLIAAHYQARAARLGENAQDLYEREAPRIYGTEGRQRGGITLNSVRNTIRLLGNADASTFLHETAHDWLMEMHRDAARSEAVAADLETVRQWLGVTGELTRRQHELFARGFERYMMEGRAPTPKLARVFEQFKEWLVQIYNTVARLRAPITDEIRGVYDRLLSTSPNEVVIGEGRPRPTFDEEHTATAREAIERDPTIQSIVDHINEGKPLNYNIDGNGNIIAGRGLDASKYVPIELTREEQRAFREADLDSESKDPAERAAGKAKVQEILKGAFERKYSEAEATADRIREERDKAAEGLTEDMDARRRQARSGETGTGVSGQRGTATDEPGGAGAATAAEGERTGRTGITDTTEPPTDSATGFNPIGDRLVDRAGNIRTENLTSDADVAAAIHEAAAANGGFLESRRGVLSEVETIQLADDMGMSPAGLDRWKIGQAFNAEQIVAARRLLVQQATKVRDAAAQLASVEGKLTGGEAEVAAYAKERERLMLIQEVVSGVTAEAGRAFRAFRILDQVEARQVVDLLQREMGTSPEALRREATLLQKDPSTPAVNRAVREAKQPTWKNMVVEAYINSLLSGPYTHVVNFVSNASVMVYSAAETALAAGFSRVTGSRAVSIGEVGDRLYGIAQGSIEGMRVAGDVLMNERAMQIRQSEMGPAIPGIAGQAVRIPTRLLGASDEFFKAIAFQQELNVLTRRRARAEGLEGDDLHARTAELMAAPTEAMIDAAKQHAEYQTFQTTLGPTGRAIMAFADSHPAVRFVIPFIRTPVNIFKYSMERTPFALMQERVRADLREGGAVRDTALARMTLGTTLGVAVGALAMQGLLSGGGPSKPEAQETLRQTGWQPYSLRIFDTWWSYRRFDPLANILGLAADFADIGQYVSTNDDEYNKLGTMVAMTIWRNLGDKLSLRGVSSMIKAVTEWEMNGAAFVSGLAGSLVPFSGLQGQTAGMLDPYVRETRDAMSTFWSYIGNPVQSRIPGMRESLLPRRDRWGEPVTQTDVGPIQTRAVNRDPVNDTMLALGLNKAPPERKINGVSLTPQQYDDYSRISGRLAKTILDDIVTPEFRSIAPGLQAQAISKVIDSARAYGRAVIMKDAMGGDNDVIQKGIELQMKRLLEDRAPSPFAH